MVVASVTQLENGGMSQAQIEALTKLSGVTISGDTLEADLGALPAKTRTILQNAINNAQHTDPSAFTALPANMDVPTKLDSLGSAAFFRDVAALKRAVQNGAASVEQDIKQIFKRYDVGKYLVYLAHNYNRGNPNVDDYGKFRVYAHPSDGFEVPTYFGNLQKVIASGRRVTNEERRIAAEPVRSAFRSVFNSRPTMELCDTRSSSRGAVLVGLSGDNKYYPRADEQPKRIVLTSLSEERPDGFRVFQPSWRDLATSIVLDSKLNVVGKDPIDPTKSYQTAVQTLEYVGEIAEYETKVDAIHPQ